MTTTDHHHTGQLHWFGFRLNYNWLIWNVCVCKSSDQVFGLVITKCIVGSFPSFRALYSYDDDSNDLTLASSGGKRLMCAIE